MSQTYKAMLNFNLAGLRKPVRQIIRKLEGLRLQQLLLQKVFPKILKIKKNNNNNITAATKGVYSKSLKEMQERLEAKVWFLSFYNRTLN